MRTLPKSMLRAFSSILAVSTLLYTLSGQAAQVVTETVAYSPDGNVKGFLARPADGKTHPALILIHEWWGLNDNIRDNARRFAEQGYVALAVDLYNGEVATTRDKAKELATSVRRNMNAAFANLRHAVDYLKSRPNMVITNRLGSVGWCFGGGWSYQMAKNDLGVKSSIIYYGRFNPKDDLSKMRATILGHFGEKDRAIKVDNVKEFQAKLKTLSGDHEIYIYPNADHAFANETGARYNAQAAQLAWTRTLAFLKKYL
ncbi:MAG: dienelactone hydrolase family protein [Acidiferrobacterales bacterium]